MNIMKKLIGAALAASAFTSGAAFASESPFSGNVALASDYTFRGISQTQEGPALQGGFDYTGGAFFAGVWASNVDFGLDNGSLEVDLYGGVRHAYGNGVSVELGVIGYLYPDASPEPEELDYFESYIKGAVQVSDALSVGGALFVSPEFTGDTGTGVYVEGNAALAVAPNLKLSGALGQQSTEEVLIGGEDSYLTWNIGGTASYSGFDFDVRWVDTDVDAVDAADGRIVFSVKRAF